MFKDHRKLRIWLYSIIIAAGPLVVFYGVASAEEVALWAGLGATVLGVPAGSLAVSNLTPPTE